MISLADQKRRIEQGALSPDAALAESLAAIDKHEPEIKAFVVRAKNPKAQKEGPLRGIAVGIKDIIDMADMPTEMGAAIYKGHQPRADASIVMLLKQAGATVVGKTTTTAFAANDPTPTLNPRNLGHTPGGSSSGSCAAIAAGMVPIAFGTQTAGSVIRPAAFCGVAGFKPSYRLIPLVGVKDVSWHLDTAGVFAAGTADVAFAAGAVTGRDLRVDGKTPAAPRIALARTHLWHEASPAMRNAVETAARAAETAGAKVSDLTLPPILEQAYAAQFVIQDYETVRSLAFEYDRHRDMIDSRLCEAMESGSEISADDYDAARRAASRGRQVLADAMANYDVILTPSAPGAALEGFATTGNPMFNRLWTLMGAPCVNVPGMSENGLPLGIQIVGRFGRDRAALEAALFVERAIAAA